MANVLLFGELKDLCGCSSTIIEAKSSNELLKNMIEKWPALSAKTIAIAVNKTIIHQNIDISEADEVALMPPYSGG